MTVFRANIVAMQGYVPGEQPPPGKTIKLNTNENPYPPSPRVLSAIRDALDAGLQRYPDPSASAFRIRAAEVLGLGPDWILCGNGSDELLTLVIRALAPEGGRVRFLSPSYVLYRTLCEIQDCRMDVVRYQSDWSVPDAFAASDRELRLALLANPNSPSGTCIRPEEVLHIAGSLSCPLLVDEAYVDFADTNCLELVRKAGNLIISRSLSKSYALAGLRFGYLIAEPSWIEQLRKVKDSYNCDALSISGATAAINDQSWLQTTRAKVLATRERMRQALGELGLQVTTSQANFLWCTSPGRPLRPIYEGLKRHQILVRYMDYPDWGEGLRVSVGTDDQFAACHSVLQSLL